MRIIIHDLNEEYNAHFKEIADRVVHADGKYAPCQGCFHCWTKNPATCDMKDALQEICRVIGQADELIIITENCYGGYSPAVKNIIDRSIGTSTPMSTYRGKLMHHTLRYGKHDKLKVLVYGEVSDFEKNTWELLAERNALNEGFYSYEVSFLVSEHELEVTAI